MYWSYLIKVSITFTILYSFYLILLKNITFHKANRFFLILSVIISIIIPFIKVPGNSFTTALETSQFINFDNYVHINNIESSTNIESVKNFFSVQQLLSLIYLSGIILFSIAFIKGIYKIVHNRYNNKVVKKDHFAFILQSKDTVPYSFFNWIFIPEKEYKIKDSNIIEHEKVHSKQFHTFDIILTELFCIAFWFLPFVYAFKKSLRNVHEFLADQNFNSSDNLKIAYLELISTNTEKLIVNKITNTFYSKSIKNRVIMMTKPHSSKKNILKFSIILPVLFILATAFSQIDNISEANYLTDNTLKNPTFIYPIQEGEYRITSTFGERMHPIKKRIMMHNAIDMAAKTGTKVKASTGGVVIRKEFNENGYGNVIAIQHINGYVSVYAQLSAFKTKLGQKVKQGELIGLVGSSGMSNGPHLHFEIRKDGEYINPELMLNKLGTKY